MRLELSMFSDFCDKILWYCLSDYTGLHTQLSHTYVQQYKINVLFSHSLHNERTVTNIHYSKTFGLALIWLLVAFYLLVKEEKILEKEIFSVSAGSTLRIQIPYESNRHSVRFIVEGYFTDDFENNSTDIGRKSLEFNFFGEMLDFLVRNF